MAENKGKGVKGRPYDEVSGVGTSDAGITGTTGNLNDNGRDGGVGQPPLRDEGNRQSVAEAGQTGDTPALGNVQRVPQHYHKEGDDDASAPHDHHQNRNG
jgi:hypothetical protein